MKKLRNFSFKVAIMNLITITTTKNVHIVKPILSNHSNRLVLISGSVLSIHGYFHHRLIIRVTLTVIIPTVQNLCMQLWEGISEFTLKHALLLSACWDTKPKAMLLLFVGVLSQSLCKIFSSELLLKLAMSISFCVLLLFLFNNSCDYQQENASSVCAAIFNKHRFLLWPEGCFK